MRPVGIVWPLVVGQPPAQSRRLHPRRRPTSSNLIDWMKTKSRLHHMRHDEIAFLKFEVSSLPDTLARTTKG